MPILSFRLAFAAALAATPVAGEPLRDAATGLAVDPPAGYEAKAGSPTAQYSAVFDVKTPADTDTGCRVAFQNAPQNAGLSQDDLNDLAARPEWADLMRSSLGSIYDIRTVAAFEHVGVRGAAIVGDIKKLPNLPPRAQDIRTLFFIQETPKGRTTTICVGEKADFDARQSEFEAVARAVTLPR